MTKVARLLAALAVAAIMLLIPVPADAIPGVDCKEAPLPEAPGRGPTGIFLDEPKTLPTGESWQGDHPVFEHYGYAGYRWNTYDLGCGADLARNPGAVVGTEVGNWLYELPKLAVGLTIFTVDAAFHPDFMNVFNPLVLNTTRALKAALFDQWIGVLLVVVGATLLWKARSMAMSQALVMGAWALFVLIVVTAVVQWPLRAGEVTDQAITQTLGGVNRGINGSDASADPADEVSQNLTNAVLYEQWKMGQFGDANSATASKYARAMWESQTLTWAEARTVAADPDGDGKDLLEAKAKRYESTAEKIKKEDPDAYAYLTGKRSSERFGAAFIASFAAAVACPFLLMSSVLILAAYLIVRLAVIFLPAIATLGVAYQFRGMVKGLGSVVAAAVVNCIAFGVGAAVAIYGIGVLLSPTNGLPQILRLFLVALLTFIMWVVCKPFRRLTTMVGANHNVFGGAAGALGDTGRNAMTQAKGMARQAVSSYIGNTVADKTQERRERKKADKERRPRAEENNLTVEQVQPEQPVMPHEQPQQPALGMRPAHREDGPYPRPAGREPAQPVTASPVPDQVATRPSHNEVGPYAATKTGGAVAPVQVAATPPGDTSTPVSERPEYLGGRPATRGDAPPADGIWRPGEPLRRDGEVIDPVRVADPQRSDDGEATYTIWRPDTGTTEAAAPGTPVIEDGTGETR
jgi:hypothetical protein